MQLETISLKKAKQMIAWNLAANKATFLLGSPGIGKSAIFKEIALERYPNNVNSFGCGFSVFDGVSIDPTDSRGLLYISETPEDVLTRWSKSPLLPNVKKHGEKGILLFDDLSNTARATMVALYSVFHSGDRRIGEYKIPPGWIPCGTGNRTIDGSGALDLVKPLQDRVSLLEVYLPFEDWKTEFALKPSSEGRQNIHPLVLGYLNLFKTFDGINTSHNDSERRVEKGTGKNFATPRSHTELSDSLWVNEREILSEDKGTIQMYLASFVGINEAVKYTAFIDHYNSLPKIGDILKGQDIYPMKEDGTLSLDKMHAILSILVSRVHQEEGAKQKTILKRVIEYGLGIPDMVLCPVFFCDLWVSFRNKGFSSGENPVQADKKLFEKIVPHLSVIFS